MSVKVWETLDRWTLFISSITEGLGFICAEERCHDNKDRLWNDTLYQSDVERRKTNQLQFNEEWNGGKWKCEWKCVITCCTLVCSCSLLIERREWALQIHYFQYISQTHTLDLFAIDGSSFVCQIKSDSFVVWERPWRPGGLKKQQPTTTVFDWWWASEQHKCGFTWPLGLCTLDYIHKANGRKFLSFDLCFRCWMGDNLFPSRRLISRSALVRFSNNTQVNQSHKTDNDGRTIWEDNVLPRRPTENSPSTSWNNWSSRKSNLTPPGPALFYRVGRFYSSAILMSYLPLISVCSAALSDKGLAGKQLEAAHWHDLVVSFSTNARATLFPSTPVPEPLREHTAPEMIAISLLSGI